MAEQKPRHIPGRVVYVGLRVYDPTLGKMRSCKGLGFRLEKFTPEEVHRIIRDAVLTAVPTARVIRQEEQT